MHSAATGTNLLTKLIHYRKYLSNLIAGIILIIEITACQSLLSPKSTPTPTPTPPAWFTEWLTNPVCQPPCWEGITPGKTTITDTQKILSELPWINVDYGPGKVRPNDSRLTLTWQTAHPSQVSGYAYSDNQEDLTIDLGFEGILSTKLKEVIDNYGNPSHVFVVDCQYYRCYTEIIYMTSGLVINLVLDKDWRGNVNVSPDAEIRGGKFFPPGGNGFSAAFPGDAERFQKKAVPWVGYSKYKPLR